MLGERTSDAVPTVSEHLAEPLPASIQSGTARDPDGAALLPKMGGSDFLDSASGKSCKDVMKVVDEHLETIRMLYPKTYDSVIERIRQLG